MPSVLSIDFPVVVVAVRAVLVKYNVAVRGVYHVVYFSVYDRFKFREKLCCSGHYYPHSMFCFEQWIRLTLTIICGCQSIHPYATIVGDCASVGVLFSSSDSSGGFLHARKAYLL